MFKKSAHNYRFANHLKLRKPRRSQMTVLEQDPCALRNCLRLMETDRKLLLSVIVLNDYLKPAHKINKLGEMLSYLGD